ncbi:MAG: protein kinase domain-containing protein [Ktedonobacterales bacterium]
MDGKGLDGMQARRLGSYELIRRLGEGGMAHVYLARDVRLGREVAVKVLDQRLAERPGFRERFQREARVAAALDHPHIVPLYDFGESGYELYLVMPYISGGSLQDVLKRTPLSVSEVVTYGSQMADALDYAHRRSVVHRDVKPANMLIHADGRLLLSDFGLAKIISPSTRSATTQRHPDAGTPEYMAPEQIEGRTDERSDIYALGVVLYLLLTGHLPFTGATANMVMEGHLYRLPEQPRRLNPAVTPAIQAVILRALAKHSEDRYQKAKDLGDALLSALVAGEAEPIPFTLSDPGTPPISLPQIASPSVSRAPSPHTGPSGFAWPTPQAGNRHPTGGPSGTHGTGRPSSGAADILPRLDVLDPPPYDAALLPQPFTGRPRSRVTGAAMPSGAMGASGTSQGTNSAYPRLSGVPGGISGAPFNSAVSHGPISAYTGPHAVPVLPQIQPPVGVQPLPMQLPPQPGQPIQFGQSQPQAPQSYAPPYVPTAYVPMPTLRALPHATSGARGMRFSSIWIWLAIAAFVALLAIGLIVHGMHS